MTVGVITGMYSSVYIAAPFLLWVSRSAEKR
jgi:preprotein translocase subunit SecF